MDARLALELIAAVPAWAWKGAGLLAVALAADVALRRRPAALRHLVWSGSLVGVLALPFAQPLLPSLDVPLPTSLRLPVAAPAGDGGGTATVEESTPAAATGRDAPAGVAIGAEPVTAASSYAALGGANGVAAAKAPQDGASCSGAAAAPAGREAATPASFAATMPGGAPALVTGRDRDDAATPAASVTRGGLAATAPALLAVVWALGALAVATRLGASLLRRRRLLATGRPLGADWQALAAECAGRLGVRRDVRLLASVETEVPMTWGILSPVVLLPAIAGRWPEPQRRSVLLHELAHVKRGDALNLAVSQLACTVHWFDPLAWIAAHRMRAQAEHACDDLVLLAGSRPSLYAGHLVDIARALRSALPSPAVTLPMARRGQLSDRVAAILDEARERATVSRLAAGAAVLVAALVAVPLAAARVQVVAPLPPAPPAPAVPGVAAVPAAAPVAAVPAPPAPAVPRMAPAPAAAPIPAVPPVPASERTGWLPALAAAAPAPPPAPAAPAPAAAPGFPVPPVPPMPLAATGEAPPAPVAAVPAPAAVAAAPAAPATGRASRAGAPPAPAAPPAPPAPGTGWHASFGYDTEAHGSAGPTWEEGCHTSGSRSHSTSVTVDDDGNWKVRSTVGRCRLEVDLQGEVVFSPDETTVARIGRGARLRVLERRPGGRHELLVTAGPDGRPVAVWEVDGERRPFDAGGRQWFARFVPELFRQTGIDAAGRVGRLLARGGVDAVLAETERITSDSVGALYYRELLRQAEPTDDQVRRLVATAAERLESDHEMARVLTAAIASRGADAVVSPAFVAACRSIGSDHDLAKVLLEVVQRAARPAAVERALECAGGIDSDHDLKRVLVALAGRWPSGQALPPAFYAAAGSVGSDFDLRQTLQAAAARRPLTEREVRAILAASRGIGSDFDLAELLVGLAAATRLQGELSAAYLEAAEEIGSEHDRNRALAALARSGQAAR